jgi:hypothetical protein
MILANIDPDGRRYCPADLPYRFRAFIQGGERIFVILIDEVRLGTKEESFGAVEKLLT